MSPRDRMAHRRVLSCGRALRREGFGLAPQRGRGQGEIGCGTPGASGNDVEKSREICRHECDPIAGSQPAGQPWKK